MNFLLQGEGVVTKTMGMKYTCALDRVACQEESLKLKLYLRLQGDGALAMFTAMKFACALNSVASQEVSLKAVGAICSAFGPP